jgi:amidase
LLERAESSPGLSDPHYQQARTENLKAAGRDGIDRLLKDYALDGLIVPTAAPAWNIDLVNGDPSFVALSSTLPAVAGYPHLTVPMGQIQGLPVGLSFVGRAWSEGSILAMGYAFELRSAARRPPSFVPSIDAFRIVQRGFVAHPDH